MKTRNPISALTILVAAGAIIATLAMLGEARYVFLAAGLWALTLVLIPIARAGRAYDRFSVWSFAALTIAIGMTARGACLTLGYPDAERLDDLYWLGKEPSFFVKPALGLLIGLAMLMLGYLAGTKERPPLFAISEPDPRRVRAICLALLAISSAATVIYISRTGGWSSGDWTGKRTPIPGGDLTGTGYQSHGGWRFLASLAVFGHVLALACQMRSLAVLLLLVGCVVPFYASLRTTVALQLLLPLAMIYYSGRRGTIAPLLASVAVLALIIHGMTLFRPASAEPGRASLTRVFDSIILNRNQIDLPKTAHIISAVPGELPLAYGRTIAMWALAPIPRSLWPDKPPIPPGPIVGRTLYDQPAAGVPPSLVAEWYWNFHWPGAVIGCFAFGYALAWIQSRFQAARGRDPLRAALYVAGPMTLGFEAIGSSIGSGLFRAALHTVIILALIRLAGHRGKPAPLPR